GSLDKTARLWSAETGEAIGEAMRHEASVEAVAFSPDGRRTFAFTQWWMHVAELDGDEWRAAASRLLPGAWRWRSQCHFLDPAGSRIQLGVGVTGNSTRVMTIALDYSDAEPMAGDRRRLLDEWQRRLGLKINAAGEIVPLWQ
ncbi:MAG: hypothetical protein ACREEM_51360, partial [Blastocatellia bacterium]